MTLKLNICSECGLIVSINGKNKQYYSDGCYVFKNMPNSINMQITQFQSRRKWFLFPFYIIEGLLTLLLNCYSEFFSVKYLHPYIYKCSFIITKADCCKL